MKLGSFILRYVQLLSTLLFSRTPSLSSLLPIFVFTSYHHLTTIITKCCYDAVIIYRQKLLSFFIFLQICNTQKCRNTTNVFFPSLSNSSATSSQHTSCPLQCYEGFVLLLLIILLSCSQLFFFLFQPYLGFYFISFYHLKETEVIMLNISIVSITNIRL